MIVGCRIETRKEVSLFLVVIIEHDQFIFRGSLSRQELRQGVPGESPCIVRAVENLRWQGDNMSFLLD